MKLIDWSRVPRGTMTNFGELVAISKTGKGQILDRFSSKFELELRGIDLSELRITPQARWTYHDGGECPVPDGLTFEHITRAGFEWDGDDPCQWEHLSSNSDVIAYRITGVDRAGGWTDDASGVTQ
jgi:hypothetical protein